MIIKDDRTEEQKETHLWAVVGTDPFMSGWGQAEGGVSYAAWATNFEGIAPLEERIRNRDDMKRVRTIWLKDYRPRGKGHLHIYIGE